jgi:hypothetical protein
MLRVGLSLSYLSLWLFFCLISIFWEKVFVYLFHFSRRVLTQLVRPLQLGFHTHGSDSLPLRGPNLGEPQPEPGPLHPERRGALNTHGPGLVAKDSDRRRVLPTCTSISEVA